MKKKLLIFALILSALLCVFAISVFAADITVDHINYTTNGTKAYFNANTPTDGTITELVIPEKITFEGVEYSVVGTTRIDGNWPTEDTLINSVVSVTFPATVTSIDTHTFRQYKGLKYVEFKGEITAFNDAEFYECTALEEVKFAYPDSVVNLHQFTFTGCEKLATISPLNNLVKIGPSALRDVPATYITDFSDVTTIGEWAFCDSGITGKFYIPNLNSISSHAFRECHNLTGIKLGGSFTALYNACFYNCYNLEYVVLSSSVKTLDQHVFAKCSELEYIVVKNALTSASTSNLFQNCNKLKSILYTGNNASDLTSLSVFSSCATAQFADYDQSNPPATRTIFYGTPVCSECGDIDTASFEFDFFGFTSKMYDQKTCASCGYTDVAKEYAPIIKILGYSKEEATGGSFFAYGYSLDSESLRVYTEKTGEDVSYGVIVGTYLADSNGDIIDKDANSLIENFVNINFSKMDLDNFSLYNIKVTGIKNDAQKALLVYCSGYAIAGNNISYLGEAETKKAVAVSYNSI